MMKNILLINLIQMALMQLLHVTDFYSNSLWPSDTIWWHRLESKITHVKIGLFPDGTNWLPEKSVEFNFIQLTFTPVLQDKFAILTMGQLVNDTYMHPSIHTWIKCIMSWQRTGKTFKTTMETAVDLWHPKSMRQYMSSTTKTVPIIWLRVHSSWYGLKWNINRHFKL